MAMALTARSVTSAGQSSIARPVSSPPPTAAVPALRSGIPYSESTVSAGCRSARRRANIDSTSRAA